MAEAANKETGQEWYEDEDGSWGPFGGKVKVYEN